MKPLCPNCLNAMSKAASSGNLFNCEPCREIIQFFGVGHDRNEAGPDFWLPVRRKRDAHAAHAL
ncbi:hypothetical protein Q3C01_20815 [Bradyrhizobium sp. UFLA05-109]